MESTLLATARPEWMDHASCKGRTTLFFGVAGERPERRVRREVAAKAMCDACPVNIACRELARDNRENGYWGGENEEQRHLAGYKVIAPIGIRAKVIRPPHETNQYHY